MYPLKFEFRNQTDPQLQDLCVYLARLDLTYDHNIHCVQTNSTELMFESQRDHMLAVLLLSDNPQYTVVSD